MKKTNPLKVSARSCIFFSPGSPHEASFPLYVCTAKRPKMKDEAFPKKEIKRRVAQCFSTIFYSKHDRRLLVV